MADKITTTFEQIANGGSGTFKIADTSNHDNLKAITIVPEADAGIDALTHVDPSGTESDAKSTRGLSALVKGQIYFAGINSYFKTIKLSSGTIVYDKA